MYRGIGAAGLRLKADQAVVDGEIVALDAQGSPIVSGAPASRLTPRSSDSVLRLRPAAPGRQGSHRRTAAEAPRPASTSARRVRPPGVRGVAWHSRCDRSSERSDPSVSDAVISVYSDSVSRKKIADLLIEGQHGEEAEQQCRPGQRRNPDRRDADGCWQLAAVQHDQQD